MEMFCYQCEQTSQSKGCTQMGVCGKDPKTAVLQDMLVYACKGIARYGSRLEKMGVRDESIDLYLIEALVTTVTNVNFDAERVEDWVRKSTKIRDKARKLYEETCTKKGVSIQALDGAFMFEPASTLDGLVQQAKEIGIDKRKEENGDDITGLEELITYGVKGMAAYTQHAWALGYQDDKIISFFHQVLDFLCEKHTVEDLTQMALKVGEINLDVMELLDRANTVTYGHPEPTKVRVEPLKGKAILVSGHDLKDLEELLKQTKDKGINVYTHGEMLPCHAYPGLKKYSHLVGNYGSAWQNQRKEFADFPGAILMTTNCIQRPKESYHGHIFTSGLVAWPGVTHIANRDFTQVIEAALKQPGFEQDGPDRKITVGFGRQAVLQVADKVIDAVKSGAIKHFFLVGGCDGAKPGRNYYTELVEKTPQDTVVLTLACGKYRFNQMNLGDIGGIPRLLDVGQCNDAYSAIKIASALAQAFGTDVNGLPLSFVLSWYEQKAVCILLTLFHLGIKNMRLGPTLPAFVTPAVLNVLVEKFKIAPTTNVDEDLQSMLSA